jgi:erythronate-4-phosphate dehydrogenase
MNLADIATPHIAGYSADGKANATRMSLESIADFYGMSKEPVSQIMVPEPENAVIDLEIFTNSDNTSLALCKE